VRHFGELAVECAPVYYMYGAALLCKAQEDRDVFGAPVQDASAARDRKADGAAPAAGPTCAPDAKGKGKAAAAPEAVSEEEEEEDGGSDGSSDDEDGGGGGEEEMSDLQLAWENLEYARLIYSGGVVADEGGAEGGGGASAAAAASTPALDGHAPEHAEALAQVHVKLGQVSAEEEQFEAALCDYDKALALFGALAPTPHRRIAGILYDSAYALQQLERNEEALARFGQAVAACQRRLTELRMAAPAGADAGAASAAAESAAAETAEIGALVTHLRALEEDLRMSAAEQERTKDALKAAFAGMAGAASGAAAFDAPRMAAAAPAANLGVAGRGVTRITPAGAPAAAAPQQAPVRRVTPQAEPAAAPKRTLEDALASGSAPGQAGDAAKAAKPAAAAEADGCKQQ
jgi:nuclear autoantigenic sperm protein